MSFHIRFSMRCQMIFMFTFCMISIYIFRRRILPRWNIKASIRILLRNRDLRRETQWKLRNLSWCLKELWLLIQKNPSKVKSELIYVIMNLYAPLLQYSCCSCYCFISSYYWIAITKQHIRNNWKRVTLDVYFIHRRFSFEILNSWLK